MRETADTDGYDQHDPIGDVKPHKSAHSHPQGRLRDAACLQP